MNIRHRFYQFYLYLVSLWERYITQLRKTARFIDNSFKEEIFYFSKENPFPAPSTEYPSHEKLYIYSRDARLLTSVAETRRRTTECLLHTLDILDARLSLEDSLIEHDLTEFFQNTRYVDAPPVSVWIWAWALENRLPLFPQPCRLKISTFDGMTHEFTLWGDTDEDAIWQSVHTPFEMHRQIPALRIRTPLEVKGE